MNKNTTREQMPAAILGLLMRGTPEGLDLGDCLGRMEYRADMQCYCYFPGGGLAIYDEDMGVFLDKVYTYLIENK